nr:MAG TPA: hypothetical protein [Caudoviricetes sp.]
MSLPSVLTEVVVVVVPLRLLRLLLSLSLRTLRVKLRRRRKKPKRFSFVRVRRVLELRRQGMLMCLQVQAVTLSNMEGYDGW